VALKRAKDRAEAEVKSLRGKTSGSTDEGMRRKMESLEAENMQLKHQLKIIEADLLAAANLNRS
jgi:hypothetical protein